MLSRLQLPKSSIWSQWFPGEVGCCLTTARPSPVVRAALLATPGLERDDRSTPSPPQISRSDLAPPSWQNNMATNCPQLLKPRACRSALCLRAAVSNPVREMSCKICEKMLHTLFKAESSSDWFVFANSTYQRLSAFFFPKAIRSAELIWTRLTAYDTCWLLEIRHIQLY